jgi:hypothetical protein
MVKVPVAPECRVPHPGGGAGVATHPGGFAGVEVGVTGRRRGLVAVELEDGEGGRESHLDHSSAAGRAGLSAAVLDPQRPGVVVASARY